MFPDNCEFKKSKTQHLRELTETHKEGTLFEIKLIDLKNGSENLPVVTGKTNQEGRSKYPVSEFNKLSDEPFVILESETHQTLDQGSDDEVESKESFGVDDIPSQLVIGPSSSHATLHSNSELPVTVVKSIYPTIWDSPVCCFVCCFV